MAIHTDFAIRAPLSRSIDVLRAFSAFLVVIGHIRLMLYGQGHDLPLLIRAVTGLGGYAVIIFFVLSGFLISRECAAAWITGAKSPLVYAVDRFTRIYIVLIPALLATAVIDLASGNGGNRMTAAILVGNVFALQDIYVPPFGTNGPLWSLSYELWYYLLFPIMIYSVIEKRVARRAAAVGFLLAAAIFLGIGVIKLMVMWLAGALAWLPNRPIIDRRFLLVILAALLLFGGSVETMPSGWGYLHLCAIAGCTAALLNEYKHVKHTSGGDRIPAFFSQFSFSVYLFHFPVLLAVVSELSLKHSGHRALWSGALLVLAYIYSYAMYWLFERHYHRVRSVLMLQLSKARFTAQPAATGDERQ